MATIEELADAAGRIGQSAKTVQARTSACAENLKTHSARLAAVVRGSRSGEDAVRLVTQAERAVRDSAAQMLALRTTVDRYLQNLRTP